jgi:hypothetical protein
VRKLEGLLHQQIVALENISELFLYIREGRRRSSGLWDRRNPQYKAGDKRSSCFIVLGGAWKCQTAWIFQGRYHLSCVKEPDKGDRKSLLNSLMCCT